jgi:hypothetical protein
LLHRLIKILLQPEPELKVGDIITRIENYVINNEQTLIGVFQEFRAGPDNNLNIVRDNDIIEKK